MALVAAAANAGADEAAGVCLPYGAHGDNGDDDNVCDAGR